MKVVTKLSGLMLTFLFMLAIVVGQSQQSSINDLKPVPSIGLSDQGAEAVIGDQNLGPIASQLTPKSGDNTDAYSAWVLLTGANGYSQNSRAPSNYWKYQRTVYLLTAAEMATAGFTAGEALNSIGWYNLYDGNGTLAGNLDIYLLNTADVSFNASYATWANMQAAFTKVSALTSWTVPIEDYAWNAIFSLTNYNYTGGGLYVAWEFQSPTGTSGTYPVAHYTNSGTAGLLYGGRSNTGVPPSLSASAFRPITWLSSATPNADIVKITNIYTNEIDAHPYGVPTPIKVQVYNVSASAVTFDLTLQCTDGYSQTVTVTGLAGNTGQTVAFPNWSPSVDGDYTFTASTSVIAGEGFTENNSYLIDVNVNTSEVSYSYYAGPYSYGWTYPGFGIFSEKHHMNGSGIITGAALGIASSTTNTGNTVYGVVLNSAGTIVATSAGHVILATELNTVIAVAFATPPVFTDEDYYIGMLTSAGTAQHYPMMAQTETPNRPDGFFNFASTGGTPTAATWRYILGALVAPYVPCAPPTGLNVANITATTTDLIWTSGSGTSQVEWGLTGFIPTGIPSYTGTSPYTIPTSPNTGYDFYVRDVCAGPIYSSWVLKTFWTFCEDCPPGGIAEGEPQLPNGSDGSGINGGCAVGDPLLTLPIAPGQTYCGQSNSFINNVGANARDNDYYVMDLTTPANVYWNVKATIKGNGLYNMTLFNAGAMDCNISAYATVTTTAGCQLGSIDVDVPSGMYYVVARVATSAGNQWPYGTGPWQYVMTVTSATPLGAPNIDPDPAPITVLVNPGSKYSQNMVIGNIGGYPLDYAASTSGTFTTSFFDAFDTYVAGVQLALQVGDLTKWTTWSNAPGSAEDPVVSTDFAFSGPNSVLITGSNDCVHPFPNYTTGSYKLSFKMYIPSGFDGYFNVLQLFNGANSEWGFQAYFDAGGAGSCDAGGANSATWTFAYDTWLTNEVYIDLDADYAEFWFDGVFVVSWQWSTGTFGSGTLKQLGGVNLYAYTGTQTPKYYFDDFTFETAVNDWLTLDGGLGVSGTVGVGAPAINVVLGFDSSKPVGTYTKTINLTTNELGAKTSYAIPVTMMVGYALSGNVYYGITGTSKPMQTNTNVICTPGPTVPTGAGGAYTIRPLANGNYGLSGSTTKPYGGLQALDAIQVQRFVAGAITFTNLQKRSADVNKSSSVQNLDATFIRRRVSSIAVPQWIAPDWIFDGPFGTPPALQDYPVTISGSNVTLLFRTVCSGDVNGSYSPPAE
jgi:hypothetical protein